VRHNPKRKVLATLKNEREPKRFRRGRKGTSLRLPEFGCANRLASSGGEALDLLSLWRERRAVLKDLDVACGKCAGGSEQAPARGSGRREEGTEVVFGV